MAKSGELFDWEETLVKSWWMLAGICCVGKNIHNGRHQLQEQFLIHPSIRPQVDDFERNVTYDDDDGEGAELSSNAISVNAIWGMWNFA